MRAVEAKYEDGLLKPTAPLALRPGERVGVIVVRLPDPKRWDLERFSETSRQEDSVLADAGLGDWVDALTEEDRH
jgi:predicted DNA-binding antitoxin AbrB/MazE fold protein